MLSDLGGQTNEAKRTTLVMRNLGTKVRTPMVGVKTDLLGEYLEDFKVIASYVPTTLEPMDRGAGGPGSVGLQV